MSLIVASIVQRKRVGSATAKAVLMYMADCASDDGSGIWTAKSNIAADLEMGRRTVQEAIDRLVAAGLVKEVGTRPHKNGVTIEYAIILTAIEGLISTRAVAAPVREPHPLTRAVAAPRAGAARQDVRQPHTNHPITILEERESADALSARATECEPIPVDRKPKSDTAEIGAAVDDWNAAADRQGWPKAQVVSPARRSAIAARLRDAGGIEGWRAALAKAEASDFLCGRAPPTPGRQPFRATIDFLTQQSSFTRLMEGNYDNRPDHRRAAFQPQPSRNGSTDPMLAAIARRQADRAH